MENEATAITIADPGLSWSQLRSFEACARLGSFNGAATALRLTPAAVRHQVGLMEQRIGAVLFLRQGGRLGLTAAGRRLCEGVSGPMRQLARVCHEARETSAAAPLVLTAPPLFARQYLFDAAFLRWSNEAGISIDVTDARRDLLGIAPTAAIRLGNTDHPDLVETPLVVNVGLQLAAAPKACESEPVRLRDPAWWRRQVLLTPIVAEPVWARLWRRLGVAKPGQSRQLKFTSYAAALDAACNGKGLVMAPMPMATSEIETGRLRILSSLRLESPISFVLVMRRTLAQTAPGKELRRRVLRVVGKAKT